MEPDKSDPFKYFLTFLLVGLSLFAPLSSDGPETNNLVRSTKKTLTIESVSHAGSRVASDMILPLSK